MRTGSVVLMLAISLLPGMAVARDEGSSWESLNILKPGAPIEVFRKAGDPVRGTFTTLTPESVGVRTKQQEIAVPRADVARVRTKRKRRAKWIGLAIGAGAGAGTGSALGARLANESAGDIDVRSLSIATVAVAGALIGLGIGAALDSRHATIYTAR
ncbi:MAG: hypothetical protein ABUS51_05455 [Acidobacteriota bacterium]